MTSKVVPVRTFLGIVLLIVPAALIYLAIPRFTFGLSSASTERLVLLATYQQSISLQAARAAATALERAPAEDGNDLAQASEFLALGAAGDSILLARSRASAIAAITHAPTNPLAWTLLCEAEASRRPLPAVSCLDTSFSLTRYDWFTADERMRLIAEEWPFLNESLRDSAAGLIIPMWYSAHWDYGLTLRNTLYNLSRSENGRQLLRAGFAGDRQALRDFNRFAIQKQFDGY